MLRIFLAGLGLFATIYGLKVVLIQLSTGGVAPPWLSFPIDELTEGIPSHGASGAEGAGNLTDLQAALASYRNNDDAKALSILESCIGRPLAEQGEDSVHSLPRGIACETALGELHLVGAGVPLNLTKAQELFQAAADKGEPEALYNLGILYSSLPPEPGEDLQRREAMAVLHLYAASTAGHTGALMAMGYRHLHGYGVPQACTTAALNYIDVAKKIASVYSAGMPQAVELIRLNLHQKDRKVISSSELNLFVQIATSGDSTVAAAIGKRYLLGIEGFRQDYGKAKHYLRMAANKQHPGALGLLGYMHCLGLGTPVNMDTAYAYFVTAATHNDPLGHNGLGFVYFKGTQAQARNLRLAFKHFNESAFAGSSDGMFNLASMYLTGTGTEQSFQKAVLYYTQALDQGHTPAAYSLAVMHLNGIGTVRDCDIAVNLLKKVCERGEWVSSKLVSAYDYGDKEPEKAALLFLKLAESGHEVAQMNAAHLFDSGMSNLLFKSASSSPLSPAPSQDAEEGLAQEDDARSQGRALAQRFYELSAEQGSSSSELRLGDYSYYGWGVSTRFREDFAPPARGPPAEALGEAEVGEEEWEDFPLPSVYTTNQVELKSQSVDYEAALARYRKTAEMTVTGEWMQSFVARASFNLGFMHQFGLGINQDMHMAKQHYFRCREVDPGGMHAPVTLSLAGLAAHMMFLRLPSGDKLAERLSADFRVHVLVLHLITMVTLALIRCWLASRRPRPRPPPTLRPPEAAPGVATTSGTEFPNGGDAPGPDVRRRAEGNLVID